tara:strand:+ start:5941 stop:6582 length:642 start_codon:yes stop_codon:yes gene_type:complete
MIKISVIVPVYNQEKFLGRCIRSLLSQQYNKNNYEIIIVNDGSTDNTQKVINKYADQLEILNNEDNLGLPQSLNIGINYASGSFIVRVDSDDYVNNKFLLYLSDFLIENSEYDAVASDYLLVNDTEAVLKRENCEVNPIACGIMFRLEQLIDIGLYNEEFHFREEEELRIRFEKKYSIHRIPLPLYRYRKHENNMTNNIQKMAIYKNKLNDKK